MKSCENCQRLTLIRKKRNNLGFSVLDPFKSFSIDLRRFIQGNIFWKQNFITAVEYLTCWPLAVAVEEATADLSLKVIERDIVKPFGFPKSTMSDNEPCFTATSFLLLLRNKWIQSNTILTSAPM